MPAIVASLFGDDMTIGQILPKHKGAAQRLLNRVAQLCLRGLFGPTSGFVRSSSLARTQARWPNP